MSRMKSGAPRDYLIDGTKMDLVTISGKIFKNRRFENLLRQAINCLKIGELFENTKKSWR